MFLFSAVSGQRYFSQYPCVFGDLKNRVHWPPVIMVQITTIHVIYNDNKCTFMTNRKLEYYVFWETYSSTWQKLKLGRWNIANKNEGLVKLWYVGICENPYVSIELKIMKKGVFHYVKITNQFLISSV